VPYFEDLSPYTYVEEPEAMINIGWLSRDHEFATCEPDPLFLAALEELAATPANMMRGFQWCPFCDVRPPIEVAVPNSPNKRAWLGTGEIHVRGEDGACYSAPTLVVHYVRAHRYCPPDPFVLAVRAIKGRAVTGVTLIPWADVDAKRWNLLGSYRIAEAALLAAGLRFGIVDDDGMDYEVAAFRLATGALATIGRGVRETEEMWTLGVDPDQVSSAAAVLDALGVSDAEGQLPD
jgi:hypothetical protein